MSRRPAREKPLHVDNEAPFSFKLFPVHRLIAPGFILLSRKIEQQNLYVDDIV